MSCTHRMSGECRVCLVARAEKAEAEVERLRALLEAAEVDKIRILDDADEVERLREALATCARAGCPEAGRAMSAKGEP